MKIIASVCRTDEEGNIWEVLVYKEIRKMEKKVVEMHRKGDWAYWQSRAMPDTTGSLQPES